MSTILQQQQIWVSSHFNPFREDTHNLRCYDLTIKMVLGGWGPPPKKSQESVASKARGFIRFIFVDVGNVGVFPYTYRTICHRL